MCITGWNVQMTSHSFFVILLLKEGRKHRASMLLYEDLTYLVRIHLQAPFRNLVLTPAVQAFNSSMSAVRQSVEWLLGYIVNYFKLMDFHKNLKIGLSSVGKMYIVSALLSNAHTILI